MNKVSENEMRTVDGGYRLICNYCYKQTYCTTPIGVTAFYLKHKHGYSFTWAAWNTMYKNADKFWS